MLEVEFSVGKYIPVSVSDLFSFYSYETVCTYTIFIARAILMHDKNSLLIILMI